MHDRLQKTRSLLDRNGCTHLLISDPVDVLYLTGFHASQVFLLLSRKEFILFTDFRYQEAAQQFCSANPGIKPVIFKEGNFSWLKPFLKGGSRTGLQSDVLTLDQFEKLQKVLSSVRFIPLHSAVSDCFIVKTSLEIAAMKKAAKIGDAAFLKILHCMKSGITERDLAEKLELECKKLGSEKPSFDTIILFAEHSALPHGVPGNRKLKKGDLVLMDFGCTVDRLCSDMTRTVVFGPANTMQKKIYSIVKKSQAAARAAVRSGMPACGLDALARTIIEKAGYGDAFGHALGHGVGRRVHEAPRLSSTNKAMLEQGSVVTIEPGIYLPGFGGVRIEDMAVARKDRADILTHAPRHLIEV